MPVSDEHERPIARHHAGRPGRRPSGPSRSPRVSKTRAAGERHWFGEEGGGRARGRYRSPLLGLPIAPAGADFPIFECWRLGRRFSISQSSSHAPVIELPRYRFFMGLRVRLSGDRSRTRADISNGRFRSSLTANLVLLAPFLSSPHNWVTSFVRDREGVTLVPEPQTPKDFRHFGIGHR